MSLVRSPDLGELLLASTARKVYCEDLRSQSGQLYAQAAERAFEAGEFARGLEHKRWLGNSLLWEGRHEEALQTALEVATCSHPEAQPTSVFGAKTDCIMIAMFHAPATSIRKLIEDAHDYLARINKLHWRHRLELLTSILLWRQGRYSEAATTAIRAYHQQTGIFDGPRYTEFAHFKWITRSLFMVGDTTELRNWINLARKQSPSMVSDRIRSCSMETYLARLERREGVPTSGISTSVNNALETVAVSDSLWDEFFDLARAFVIAPELEATLKLPETSARLLPYESALLEVDRSIHRIRTGLGLLPWDPALDSAAHIAEIGRKTELANALELDPLSTGLARLDSIARAEDERLETTACSAAASQRRRHVEQLLRATANAALIAP